MFQFYANLLSLDAKYAWNKIVREQMEAIHSRIFKACPGKAQGDFCVSHLRYALCSTFSLCFQTMQLSKKIVAFPTCSAQEAPEGWHTSVCTVRRAAQGLRCVAALLVLHPKWQCWHDASKCSILRGWSGKSCSPDVSAPVAGPVQPARKGYDSHRHAISLSFSWS